MKAILGNDIDGFPEQRFQFLDKSCGEPGTCLFSRLYKQVDIAVRRRFSSGHRAEDTYVASSVTMRATQNFRAAFSKKRLDRNLILILSD